MGSSKVVVISPRKVKLVHQLGSDGVPYAEDITIELQPDVDEYRLKFLVDQDGKIGYGSFSFSAQNPQPEGLKFPE
jgi:hypothetical protein